MSTPPISPATPWWHPTWRRLLGLSVAFFLIVLAFMGGRLAAGADPGLKSGGDQVAQKPSGGDGDSDSAGGLGVVDQVLSAVTGDDAESDEGSSSDDSSSDEDSSGDDSSSSGDSSTSGDWSQGGDPSTQSVDPNPPTTQAS